MEGFSSKPVDENIAERLTSLVHQWLADKGLRAKEAETWMRCEHAYYWNYFYVGQQWWGIEVRDDDSVKRII